VNVIRGYPADGLRELSAFTLITAGLAFELAQVVARVPALRFCCQFASVIVAVTVPALLYALKKAPGFDLVVSAVRHLDGVADDTHDD
jgi:hypothetical protein